MSSVDGEQNDCETDRKFLNRFTKKIPIPTQLIPNDFSSYTYNPLCDENLFGGSFDVLPIQEDFKDSALIFAELNEDAREIAKFANNFIHLYRKIKCASWSCPRNKYFCSGSSK